VQSRGEGPAIEASKIVIALAAMEQLLQLAGIELVD
jgi:hypothetical protein